MSNKAVLILGARSDMARAIAHRFAKAGHPVQLAARNAGTLEAERNDMALRYNVEVTLHDFDVLDTGAFESFIDSLPETEDRRVRIPMGRYGRAAEVSSLISWLASDEGSYMTGQNLRLDGGLTRAV